MDLENISITVHRRSIRCVGWASGSAGAGRGGWVRAQHQHAGRGPPTHPPRLRRHARGHQRRLRHPFRGGGGGRAGAGVSGVGDAGGTVVYPRRRPTHQPGAHRSLRRPAAAHGGASGHGDVSLSRLHPHPPHRTRERPEEAAPSPRSRCLANATENQAV